MRALALFRTSRMRERAYAYLLNGRENVNAKRKNAERKESERKRKKKIQNENRNVFYIRCDANNRTHTQYVCGNGDERALSRLAKKIFNKRARCFVYV